MKEFISIHPFDYVKIFYQNPTFTNRHTFTLTTLIIPQNTFTDTKMYLVLIKHISFTKLNFINN